MSLTLILFINGIVYSKKALEYAVGHCDTLFHGTCNETHQKHHKYKIEKKHVLRKKNFTEKDLDSKRQNPSSEFLQKRQHTNVLKDARNVTS
jgi:hypothetical protein